MTDATRMSLLILAVQDLERAARFYREGFGWPQQVDVPVYVEFRLPDGLRLGLYERRAFGANTGSVPFAPPGGALAPAELYFHPDDLEACSQRLERAGARTLSALARRAWGDEAVYFADPDGNVVVLARPAPAEG